MQNAAQSNGQSGPKNAIVLKPSDVGIGGTGVKSAIKKALDEAKAQKDDKVTLNIITHGTAPIGKTDEEKESTGGTHIQNEDKSQPDGKHQLGDSQMPFKDNKRSGKEGVFPNLFFETYKIELNLYACYSYWGICPDKGKDDRVRGAKTELEVESDTGKIKTELEDLPCK